jgi:mRNA interferase MazF
MISDYDKWNKLKKKIEESNHKPPYFKESDVWWLSIGRNIGYEEYGKGENFVRPVLIIKKYNVYMFTGIPLTTKIKDNPYHLEITLEGKKVSALVSQIRTFSTKRMSNKLGELEREEHTKVLESVRDMLKLPPSDEGGSRG